MKPATMTREPSTERSRRAFLERTAGAAGVGVLASLAGCGMLTGNVEFSANAATVDDAALDETGYSKYKTDRPVVERTFEAGGQSKTVEVRNVVTQYDKSVDLTSIGLGAYQAAVFTALSTPQVEALGQTFNPVGEMSTDDLAAMVQERYEGISIGEKESEWEATVVGQSTTVARYPAEATLTSADLNVDLWLHLSQAVEADSDFVVVFGGYPRVLDQRENIEALTGGVTHESG